MSYRFILEPYKGIKTRYSCPNCQHKNKTFSHYIDIETSEHLSPKVGRCNRENSCGYHYTPKQYFKDNNISPRNKEYYSNQKIVLPEVRPVSYIPFNIFKESLTGYNDNNFIKFLIKLFGTEITTDLIGKYFIGTSNYWQKSTVFWQIDLNGKVRAGKIMLYNSMTGKRIKEPFNHIQWIHTIKKQSEFSLKQCLFGEHLIKLDDRTIAIVESEKTAIISSVFFPEYLWLASGGINSLSEEKCSILKDKKVFFLPDYCAFDSWSKKIKNFSFGENFFVSNFLELAASEIGLKNGSDIADFLLHKCSGY